MLGNTATGFTANVTVAIGTNPVAALGTTTAAVSAGVASRNRHHQRADATH
jgi:hypothetical protein